MLALDNRPKSIKDFIGQKHLVGPNKPISNMIKNNTLMHCFFYGPPGVGKTSLAKILAKELGYEFLEFNATSIKIDDLRQQISKYKDTLIKPIVFIDEIHRLNKNQQEVLLSGFLSGEDNRFLWNLSGWQYRVYLHPDPFQ